ncbi:Diacylglycerol kinase [Aquicella siphonis]|uniref:Diacylglycerol kinase n=2 Tax=Aquicella siphonis TaxID=254247 RepID=A0A5E4PKV5_9COXI|nr:Diacylglycerol kinase [Aquicella siphonis]
MHSRDICILVNPYAANARALRLLPRVEQAMRSIPLNYRLVIPSDVQQAKQAARHAAGAGECVAVFGGDGTIRIVAQELAQCNGILAVLPAGRGNDFARMLNYPLNPVAACQVLAAGKESAIDMGIVNRLPFLTICSLGLDAAVSDLANRIHFINGPAVYLIAGLCVLPRWKPMQFEVNIDGHEFVHHGHSIAVANSQYYGGGMKLAPNASVMDGMLDVVLIGMVSRFRLLLNLPRLYKGTHILEEGVKIIRGRHIRIRTLNESQIFADGDALGYSPANISVRPGALRVLLPVIS